MTVQTSDGHEATIAQATQGRGNWYIWRQGSQKRIKLYLYRSGVWSAFFDSAQACFRTKEMARYFAETGKLLPEVTAFQLPDEVESSNGELVITLSNGCKLCCGPSSDETQYGGSVTIRDQDDNEILHWTSTEWEEDPELVMGAIFGAAVSPLHHLLAGRVLEDGCWNYRGGSDE